MSTKIHCTITQTLQNPTNTTKYALKQSLRHKVHFQPKATGLRVRFLVESASTHTAEKHT